MFLRGEDLVETCFYLFFQDEHFYQRPDNAQQKHNNSNRINGMHYLKVEACGPVGIFFPEKIHKQI